MADKGLDPGILDLFRSFEGHPLVTTVLPHLLMYRREVHRDWLEASSAERPFPVSDEEIRGMIREVKFLQAWLVRLMVETPDQSEPDVEEEMVYA